MLIWGIIKPLFIYGVLCGLHFFYNPIIAVIDIFCNLVNSEIIRYSNAAPIDFLSDICYNLFVTNDLNERGELGGKLYRRAMERKKGPAYGKVL